MSADGPEVSPYGSIKGADGKWRCWWCGDDPLYCDYHDNEWGKPVTDDRRLFEKLCLEGFQSGLSWLTILKKRENFREAFHGFDWEKVSSFDEDDVERLLTNKGIVRHRGKITSVINNAKRCGELLQETGSLYDFVERFRPGEDERPERLDRQALYSLAKTPSSERLAKDLKKRGWSFVGPTTVYAFMQAMGLVNDHLHDCDFRGD